jgi:hypothetical protein
MSHNHLSKNLLRILFTCILLSLALYTGWASTRQPVLQWTGLTAGPDRYWTIATLMDAYFGFVTFYVWVFYKERRWLSRCAWFVAIMLLGNMAMSAYVLLQLARLKPTETVASILAARNPPQGATSEKPGPMLRNQGES